MEKPYLDPQEILNNLQNASKLSPDPHLTKALGVSLIAGGVYYILVFFEMGMELVFSLSLLTARDVLGPLALITGSLGIANGIFFVSLFLALPGLLFLTLVELLQLILLLRGRLLFADKVEQGVSETIMPNIADQL